MLVGLEQRDGKEKRMNGKAATSSAKTYDLYGQQLT